MQCFQPRYFFEPVKACCLPLSVKHRIFYRFKVTEKVLHYLCKNLRSYLSYIFLLYRGKSSRFLFFCQT